MSEQNTNKILEAFEHCLDDNTNCKECPYYGKSELGYESTCREQLKYDVFDLITQYKKEIERLQKEKDYLEREAEEVYTRIKIFSDEI